MQVMNMLEKKRYVELNRQKRDTIRKRILALSKERESFISEKKKEVVEKDVPTMESALVGAIRKQGAEKKYQFGEEWSFCHLIYVTP